MESSYELNFLLPLNGYIYRVDRSPRVGELILYHPIILVWKGIGLESQSKLYLDLNPSILVQLGFLLNPYLFNSLTSILDRSMQDTKSQHEEAEEINSSTIFNGEQSKSWQQYLKSSALLSLLEKLNVKG